MTEPQQVDVRPLREWREAQFLTLGELAQLVGVRLQSVWAWEHGQARPQFRHTRKLAEVLHIQPQQIAEAAAPKVRAA